MTIPKDGSYRSAQTPMVTCWEGRPITEMSRADLEAAFVELGERYTEALKPQPFRQWTRRSNSMSRA